MKRRLWAVVAVLLAAMSINAEIIFQDDFSNPGTSNNNWNPSNSSSLTKSFAGGECTATNTSTDHAVLLIHEIINPPATFTFSAKINRLENKTAGIYVCLGINEGKVSGYELLLFESNVIGVWKHKDGTSAKLFQGQSAYLVSGYNEIKISKKGSKFNIFCNNQYAGTFTDSEINSGNIALELSSGATVKYDDVILTDQFQDATIRTCFSDNFNDGNLTGWLNDEQGQATIQDNALSITTTNQTIRYLTNLELTNFVVKVTVSHRSGSKKKLYGLCLQGSPVNNTEIPSAGFLIIGDRMYGTFTGISDSFNLYSSQKISGAAYTEAGETYYFYDTLEVSKQPSTGYIFKVNNFPLCTVPEIGFNVSSVGLYCSDSLNLLFDDFVAAEGNEAVCEDEPISIREKVINRKMITITRARPYVFDPLGRAIPDFTNIELKRSVSPGIYLRADQKKTLLVVEP